MVKRKSGYKKSLIIATHSFSKSHFKVGSFYLTKHLAKKGFRILSITFPVSLFHLLVVLLNRINSNEILQKVKESVKGITLRDNNFWEYVPFSIISYKTIFPFRYFYNQHYFIPSMKKKLQRADFLKVNYLVIENPSFLYLTKIIKYKVLIYRVTDIYSEMDFKSKEFSKLESLLLDKADKVIVTSHGIRSFLRNKFKYSRRIYVLENGVDCEAILHASTKKNGNNLRLSHPHNVVYIGAIDSRLDYEFIENISKELPEIGFYFYGPSNFVDRNKFPANVIFKGPIPFEKIGELLIQFDIGILPFNNSIANQGRSPMKLYEFGICKLPVLAKRTFDLEKKGQKEKFILLYDTIREFQDCLDFALKNRNSLGKIAYQRSTLQSWKSKTDEFQKIISS